MHDHALEIKAEHYEKDENKKKRQYMVHESSTSFYRLIALPKQGRRRWRESPFREGRVASGDSLQRTAAAQESYYRS